MRNFARCCAVASGFASRNRDRHRRHERMTGYRPFGWCAFFVWMILPMGDSRAVPPVPGPDRSLVTAGRARLSVVIPEDAGPVSRKAGEDLVRCLGKALGVTIPRVDSAVSAQTPLLIVVGAREGVDLSGLADDGCVVRTLGGRILIGGRTDAGVSNGVYTLLTDGLGCRMGPLYASS